MVAVMFLSSCETDFDVNAPWKDITVVHGLLNQNDSVHYIRIQRAFLGEGNALLMAQIPDSNLYPNNLTVVLQEWNGEELMRTILTDTMTITDKDSGLFFHPVQPLYYAEAILDDNYTYRLSIKQHGSDKEIWATTPLVRDFIVERPLANANLNFDTLTGPDVPIFVRWLSGAYGRKYQVILRFNFDEVTVGSSDTTRKYVEWYSEYVKTDALRGGEFLEVRFGKRSFFTMIRTFVPINENVLRFPRNVELIFHAAGDDLNTFLEVTDPSGSLVQERPMFTNIYNGIGIFSSRFNKVRTHRLHPSTISLLANMEGYNFQWVPTK